VTRQDRTLNNGLNKYQLLLTDLHKKTI